MELPIISCLIFRKISNYLHRNMDPMENDVRWCYLELILAGITPTRNVLCIVLHYR